MLIMVALICSATIVSCKRDTVEKVSAEQIANQPTQEIKNLNALYTISGNLRNKLISAHVRQFQKGDSSIYTFSGGFYIASYNDSVMESDLKSDSASLAENPYYFTALGNVIARSVIKNERLETEGPLYWDSQKKTIETHVYSVIYRTEDTIYAQNGLFADDQFKSIVLKKQSGVFFREFEKTPKDSLTSIAADSTANN